MIKTLKVLDIKPTQFTLGMIEVQEKVEKIQKMSSKDREEYLEDRPIPCIHGPQGFYYSIDRHHLLRACWETNIKEVSVDIIADLSHLDTEDFWEVMQKARWVFLMDQFGNGPHSEKLLPKDIRGLADNPYRSLAWMVREAKGFEKENIPFIEFYWADLFRKNVSFDTSSEESIKKAKEEALAFIKKHNLKNKDVFKKKS
jgi:hypothetical protein